MKPKVLFIQSTPSPMSGSTKSLECLLNKISDNNDIDFGVILPNNSGVFKDWEHKGWRVHSVPLRHMNWPPIASLKDVIMFFPRFFFHKNINIKAGKKISYIIQKEKYNIIHTNVGVIDVGYKTAKKFKIPHIWHLREYQDLDFNEKIYPSKKFYIKNLSHKSNYCLAITKKIFKYFNIDKLKKGKYLYDAVLQESQKNINWNKNNLILFVGRISEKKGAFDVIKSFCFIADQIPKYELWMIGDPENTHYLNNLKKYVNDNGLESRIRFLGSQNNIEDFISVAKCIVVASHFEGLGRVTIEAMANGCLVVGKNTFGTKEQFDNGLELTGKEIGIRYDNQKELCSALLEISKNSIEKYKDTIERAQFTVYELYHIDKYYKILRDLYNNIINEKE